MVVTMHKMTSADGVDYLLRTVAVGDGERDLGAPLTRYYTEAGTPPGRWLGNGVAALGYDGARLVEDDEVTEQHLRRLLAEGRDPVTGLQLGRAPGAYTTPPRNRAHARQRTENDAADLAPRSRKAVAGFDFTFSPMKSVSALWAVADVGTQTLIEQAHHAAMRDVLALLEARVAQVRKGTDGVLRLAAQGVIASAFDHYDSRAGDPQLHTHVVVANHAQAPDGTWLTLYGNPIHQATVGLSRTYDAILMDRLTETLGVGWELLGKGRDRNAGWEIVGVPEALRREFSRRTEGGADPGIDERKEELIAAYRETHGHEPSDRLVIRLRQQATLETRPVKQVRSLADLTAEWRQRAANVLGLDATTWARTVAGSDARPGALRADDLTPAALDDLAVGVLSVIEGRRIVWGRWNLWAEAAVQTTGIRFASAIDREMVLDAIVGRAEDASLRLTPDYDRLVPEAMRLPDGSPGFAPHTEVLYSSQAILDAEALLLAATRQPGPRLAETLLDRYTLWPQADGTVLGDDQAVAVRRIARSGRTLDVLVGPAGAGKTATLRALRTMWEGHQGPGSVIGLAPSASAADILGHSLGIRTENTAKWEYEHLAGRWDLQRGQLVIVDEASMAGTLLLARLVAHAAAVQAKVLLVGDWAQLSAIENGGGFGLVARSIVDAPELTDVRRFRYDWEKAATLSLRHGDASILAEYAAHRRLHDTADQDAALDAVYRAWYDDRASGCSSVMIAADAATVALLSRRAREDRIEIGLVAASGVALHDGNTAGIGDEIVTRENDRRLSLGRDGWVKNGDRWHVVRAFDDGSLAVRRIGRDGSLHGAVMLPAAYVEQNVELGYATTVHRAQGMTVDTAHALIDPQTATRELLYVAMTRGATANHVYVPQQDFEIGEPPVYVGDALTRVLARVGADQSATETLRLAANTHASLATLIKEYEAIAAHAVTIGAATWPRTGDRHSVLHLIDMPSGHMPVDYADALRQRERLIIAAATGAADDAARRNQPWTREVPKQARPTVAVYRARWDITDPRNPLGRMPQDASRTQDRAHYLTRLTIERHQEQNNAFGHSFIDRLVSRGGIHL
jgi:conjugative relaxase-like TrwC/TraI family protein